MKTTRLVRRARYVLLGAVVAASLAATGCGGGSDEAAGGDDSIKVAVSVPLTGDYAAGYGLDMRAGLEAAAERLNGDGEGPRIELEFFDDQLNPQQAADVAQRVADDSSYVAYLGGASSDAALAAKPILQRSNVALVSLGGTSPEITEQGDGAFIIASPLPHFAASGAAAAREGGSESVAIVSIKGAFGDTLGDLTEEAVADAGLEVATRQTLNSGDTDLRTQMLKARQSGADTLLTVAFPTDFAVMLNAVDAIGWYPEHILDVSAAACFPSNLKVVRKLQMDNVRGLIDYNPTRDTPESGEIVDAFLEFSPDASAADSSGSFAHAYEALLAVAEAAESGAGTREELAERLYDVDIEDTGVGPLSFDDSGNPVGRLMWVVSTEGGECRYHGGYSWDGSAVSPVEAAG